MHTNEIRHIRKIQFFPFLVEVLQEEKKIQFDQKLYKISMSQYEDYFFSGDQREDQSFMLNSPGYHDDSGQQIYYLDQDSLNKKDVPPTVDVCSTADIQQKVDINPQKEVQINCDVKVRTMRVIQIDSYPLMQRKQIRKGLKNDTTQLTINLKTILLSKLIEFTKSRQFNAGEKLLVQEFSCGVSGLAAIKKLVKSQHIKEKGLAFVKSPKLIERILRSQSRFANKLTLIKYLKCVELNFTSQKIIKWKDANTFQSQ